MLMYGCGEPGSNQPVWNCGEMAKKENDDEETASPCKPGSPSQVHTFLKLRNKSAKR